MNKLLNIGQYLPVESRIHNINAVVKIVFVLFTMVAVFLINSFISLVWLLLCISYIYYLSNIPISFATKLIKPLIYIIIFTLVVHIISSFNLNGARDGLFYSLRIVTLLLASMILVTTTKNSELIGIFERLISYIPFMGHRFISKVTLIISISYGFIPILIIEANKIIMAQRARGLRFDSNNLFMRAKSYIAIIIPIIVSTFKRAREIAVSLDSRCYHEGVKHYLYYEQVISFKDVIAIFLIPVFFYILIKF